MDKNIKKAFELAEQEVQEKEITNLKKVVKDLLEKKAKAEEEKREIEKEISVIKQTIDDFKAGRLDKVKELIDTDLNASQILPFSIIIVEQYNNYTQPWKWLYRIIPTYTGPILNYPDSNWVSTTSTAGSNYIGGTCATFTSGTYDINGRIINL